MVFTKEKEGLPKDGAFIRSIVSTTMADAIANYYGIELIQVLTGFKYIGQKMLEFEQTGKGHYLFGYNRKTHLLHVILFFPSVALLSWICTLF